MPTTTTTAAIVTITFEELKTPKGNLKARKAIDSKKRLVVKVSGVEAFLAGTAITRAAGGTASVVGGGVGEVVLTVAIIAGVVAVVGLAVVAVVCLEGMNKGYRVTAKHRIRNKDTIFDDELEIILVPPGS